MQLQVAKHERELAAACKASDAVTQGLVHRMLMELETGGNIRSASLLDWPPHACVHRKLVLHSQAVIMHMQ